MSSRGPVPPFRGIADHGLPRWQQRERGFVVRQGLRRAADDRGTATVEFALVVPLLLMLVFGIIDFGRMASLQTQLTAAARAGAQAYALGTSPTAAAQAVLPGVTATPVGASCGAHPTAAQTASVHVTLAFE